MVFESQIELAVSLIKKMSDIVFSMNVWLVCGGLFFSRHSVLSIKFANDSAKISIQDEPCVLCKKNFRFVLSTFDYTNNVER